jgi:hypothetical protein
MGAPAGYEWHALGCPGGAGCNGMCGAGTNGVPYGEGMGYGGIPGMQLGGMAYDPMVGAMGKSNVSLSRFPSRCCAWRGAAMPRLDAFRDEILACMD